MCDQWLNCKSYFEWSASHHTKISFHARFSHSTNIVSLKRANKRHFFRSDKDKNRPFWEQHSRVVRLCDSYQTKNIEPKFCILCQDTSTQRTISNLKKKINKQKKDKNDKSCIKLFELNSKTSDIQKGYLFLQI